MEISVEMANEGLVIKVPKDWVYSTIVLGPKSTVVDPSDSKNFPDHAVMENFEEFVPDLLTSIRQEDETGWSLVNELIYKAAEEAMEQGAMGVKYVD